MNATLRVSSESRAARRPHLAPQPLPRLDPLFTVLILSAGTLQLALFGLLPSNVKVIGDALCIFAYAIYLRRPTTRPLNAPFFFLCYCLALSIYTIYLWGEPVLVLNQARRWIIASIYMQLIVADAASWMSPQILKRFLVVMAVAAAAILGAVHIGLGPEALLTSQETQGTVPVLKVFMPGSFVLYCLPLVYLSRPIATSASAWKYFLRVTATFVLLAIAVRLVLFRGWAIAMCGALTYRLALDTRPAKTRNRLRRPTQLVCVAAVLLTIASLFNAQSLAAVSWVNSALEDLQSGSSNVKYRRINFEVLAFRFLEESNAVQLVSGLGFVHQQSAAARFLGHSTENNDSGWVEILLTGGVAGAVIVLVAYVAVFRSLLKAKPARPRSSAVSASALWLAVALMTYSSNPLLWDFGYVPLSISIFACLRRESRHKRHTGSASPTRPGPYPEPRHCQPIIRGAVR